MIPSSGYREIHCGGLGSQNSCNFCIKDQFKAKKNIFSIIGLMDNYAYVCNDVAFVIDFHIWDYDHNTTFFNELGNNYNGYSILTG